MTEIASCKQPVASCRRRYPGIPLLFVLVVILVQGINSGAGAAPPFLDAEVLEGSGSLDLAGDRAGSVRYALIHHAREPDQAAFAEWLRSHKSAQVNFMTEDGTSHQGVLSRMKHCFGRGLLIYADPVGLAEKDSVRLELPMADMRP